MEEDPKNEDILIADHSTIDVQAIHDDHHEIHDQSIIVEEQGKDVGKEQGSWLFFNRKNNSEWMFFCSKVGSIIYHNKLLNEKPCFK